MAEEVEIPNFKFDAKEIAHQFMLVIQRGGASDLVEHLRQVILDLISRADKPEVFYPILRVLTILHDGKAPKPVPPAIPEAKAVPPAIPEAKAVPPAIPEAKVVELKAKATPDREQASLDSLPKGSQKYLRRISKIGFLDEDLKLLPDTSRSEAMYIVYRISDVLGFGNKTQWKPFEKFWGLKNLAQEKWKWVNRMSISPRIKDIDKAFDSYSMF